MKSLLVRLGHAALMIVTIALAGCGGASIGLNGTTGTTGSTGSTGSTGATGTVAGPIINAATMAPTDWQAMMPAIPASSISVNITAASGTAPGSVVAKFRVVNQQGLPVSGLGGQSVAATGALPSNFNFGFTLAKLIPANTDGPGSPSRWVNYGVVKPLSTTTPAAVSTATSSVAATSPTAGSIQWIGTYPTQDTNGTLVETIGGVPQAAGTPGDGGYQYTFLRDITQTQAILNTLATTGFEGSTNSGKKNGAGTAGVYHVADLDPLHLNYDPTATHRLGIYISGDQPGTGTATSNAVLVVPPVLNQYNDNVGFDFVPNGGTPTVTRNIVQATACDGCHDNVKFKRALGHGANGSASTSNGQLPGNIIGRNDPRLCVTCHTDQAKFGFPQVTAFPNKDGSPAWGPTPAYNADSQGVNHYYYRVPTGTVPSYQEAAYIYPRMIHQTHMGNQLVNTGYNLNNNCTGPLITNGVAQCFNQVGLPQDQRDCTKCHDGTADTANGTKDSANWTTQPNMVACGACHDGINYSTGGGITLKDRDTDIAAGNPVGTTQNGHGGNKQLDNSLCAGCHTPANIPVYHATNYVTPNSPIAAANTGVFGNVSNDTPTISYAIKSGGVTVDANGHVNYTFQILVNGTALSTLPVLSATNGAVDTTKVFYTGTGLVNGTTYTLYNGGPSFFVAYSVPQDGIVSPADFNFPDTSVSLGALLIDTTAGVTPTTPAAGYLTNANNGTNFTAASGNWFTAVLTGDTKAATPTPLVIPATATNVTGMIRGGFTVATPAYPFTAGSTTATGTHITGKIVMQAASSGTGSCVGVDGKSTDVGYANSAGSSCRRAVTSVTLCNNCHEMLGTGTSLAVGGKTTTSNPEGLSQSQTLFHTADSNDSNACPVCHTVNQADATGFAANISTWVHGIHGAAQRTVPFTAHNDFSTVAYPGLLKDCSQCHLPNTVNFGANGGFTTSSVSNLLWTYEANGGVMKAAYNQPAVVNPQTLANSSVATTTTYSAQSNAPATWGVIVGNNYGNKFSFVGQGATLSGYTPYAGNNTGGLGAVAASAVPTQVAPVGGLTVPADNATLVTSPITAACTACHTDTTAINHAQSNGGKFYVTRGSVDNGKGGLVNTEGCLACHGQGTLMDAAVVHNTN